MNLKAITAPLGDKIGDLVELVQEMQNNIEALVEVNQRQFTQLEEINKKISDDKKDICEVKNTDN